MIIKNQINGLSSADSGSFEFALLKDRTELILRNEIISCDTRDDLISLKDGKYKIINGVLYIKAIRVFWKYLPDYLEKYDTWSCRSIYIPRKNFMESVENPPEIKTVIIKRWWRNNKKIQAIELSDSDPNWYKVKEECLFEIAIGNFRLNESNLSK